MVWDQLAEHTSDPKMCEKLMSPDDLTLNKAVEIAFQSKIHPDWPALLFLCSLPSKWSTIHNYPAQFPFMTALI